MMISKIMASVVVVLALGAGVAYAATQLTSSDGTQVCVNEGSGLMRAASTCRVGEYSMTIGGGGTVQALSGTFTDVAWGTTSAGTTLPLTGVTVSGKCELQTAVPPYLPDDTGLARLLITTDTSMTAFSHAYTNGGTIGGQSLLTDPAATSHGTYVINGMGSDVLVISNGATATITFGAQVNAPARTCTYYWQAMEAPN
jgi:hypothetical protein